MILIRLFTVNLEYARCLNQCPAHLLTIETEKLDGVKKYLRSARLAWICFGYSKRFTPPVFTHTRGYVGHSVPAKM